MERTEHSAFIMGLWPGAQCHFTIEASRGGQVARQTLDVVVSPVPESLPELTLVQSRPAGAQPGWTLFNITNYFADIPLQVALVDVEGRYRWYHRRSTDATGSDNDVRTVPEGVLIGGRMPAIPPAIIDWEGAVVWEGTLEMHHDIRPFGDAGQYLTLGWRDDCPGDIGSDTVIHFDRFTDEVLWQWDICEHYTPEPLVEDWSHVNTAAVFPDGTHLLLSSRRQHALMRVSRETGDVEWVLGFGGRPQDGFNGDFDMDPEDYFYNQHSPEFQPNGNVLLFDNGAKGFRETSRAIELAYDDQAMTAEVVWEYRHDPDLFTEIWGDADRLANGNTLVTFGFRSLEGGPTTLVEVDPDGDEVWELTLPTHWGVYRAERVDDPPLGAILE